MAGKQHVHTYQLTCPNCGTAHGPHDAHCAQCGEWLSKATQPVTVLPEAVFTNTQRGTDVFQPDAKAVLYILACDHYEAIELDAPLILGRSGIYGAEETLDLSDYDAYRHGVSRWHCRLQRQGNHLMVTDLGSCNGTFLNARRLRAHRDYTVSHGDYLTLGTMTICILF